MLVRGNLIGGGGLTPDNDITISVTSVGGTSSTGIATASVSGTAPSASIFGTSVNLDFNFSPSFERDASDRTRAIRERLIYNEKRAGTNIQGGAPGLGRGNAEPIWQQQSNNFRLAYLFGKLKCGAGFAGAFNLNGANSFSSPGVQSGS